jgi:heme A synthase
MLKRDKLYTVSVVNLFYLIFVIILGSFVRATGSGAGCGSTWPLCNGEIIPRPQHIKTLVELSHRLTSSGLVLIALFLAYLCYQRNKSSLKRVINVYLLFLLVEILIGAFIVVVGHVEYNTSIYRGLSVGLHYANTQLLLSSATVCMLSIVAYRRGEDFVFKQKKKLYFLYGFFLFVGTSGAITALGDTVFPVASTQEAFSRSMTAGENILVRLRVLHPFFAVVFVGLLLFQVYKIKSATVSNSGLYMFIIFLILGQVIIGATNIGLLAPVWTQMLHLFVSLLLWVSLLCFWPKKYYLTI